ncbi:mCG67504, isoform CRA_b [Mus musculus]|nr:mCG67504, isoform CRA_b [Mus musculus]
MPVGILLFLLLANFLPRTSNSLLNRNISRRWYPRLPVHLWAFMGVLYRQEVSLVCVKLTKTSNMDYA